jgi:hypothetical protein
MKRGILLTVVVILCALGNAACVSGNLHLIFITVLGAPQNMAPGATVSLNASVSGDPAKKGLRWSCTPSASCGAASFNPDVTPLGAATVFTAPATIPAGGQVTVTATLVDKPIFTGSSTINIVNAQNFSFYATGVTMDVSNGLVDNDPYSIAGVVMIASDGSGNVIGGEQDFGDADRIAATGDTITNGSLVMNADGSGNGTLTLTTNDINVGTETFAVAFSNTNHALVTQFDGSATSSGTMDLQTSTTLPSGAFSFVTWGIESAAMPFTEGGVFTVDASGNVTGKVDTNDAGQSITPGVAIPPGTALNTPDSFGRGTVTGGLGLEVSLHYYVVGPKVLRIIDIDNGDAAVGSAYSQGSVPNFSNASIGASVFLLGKTLDSYAAAGQLTTGAGGPDNFSGVGDLNESNGALLPAATISGTYSLGADGYGNVNFAAGFGSVETLGIYAVDPTLNILDPNSTGSGGGGALLSEMDANHVGTGVLIPQTDPTATHFAGNYTFGAQGVSDVRFGEFDFLGEGTMTAGAFSGIGVLSDPLAGGITGAAKEFSNVNFASTATPDLHNVGRFTFSPLILSSTEFGNPIDLTLTVYQANAGQLFWVGMDPTIELQGTLEQSTLADAAVKKPKVK